MEKETCSTCRWYTEKHGIAWREGLICGNWHSDNFTDPVEEDDQCEYWEARICENCRRHEPITQVIGCDDPECPYLLCGFGEVVTRWNSCEDWEE